MNFAYSIIFTAFSSLVWLTINDFVISSPSGYDPLVYQYYAINQLPLVLTNDKSYNIVKILSVLYELFGVYIGYIVLIATILLFVVRDRSRIINIEYYLSPILLLYIGQPGKDAITIISMYFFCNFITTRKVFDFCIFISIASLAYYIRSAVVVYMLCIFFIYFYSVRIACFASILLGIIYTFIIKGSAIDYVGVVDDMSNGELIQHLRIFTYGDGFASIVFKFLLYSTSILTIPAGSIIKYLINNVNYYLLEFIAYASFLVFVLKKRLLLNFIKTTLPFALILTFVSPFYHSRYIGIAYPVIFILVMLKKHKYSKSKYVM